ncbi:MAG TPA: DUF1697 domain-containing protein [Flavobacteriales bacterium]|nr:DUF1697 domain-containing protein [Flavobacteriales bacterium]
MMSTYITILRGINVSGARKLPMAELRALLEKMKCARVRTYIQSGNAVFEIARLDPLAFAKQVEQRIKKQYDYDVPVLVRSLAEMKQVAAANPYLERKGIELDKLHVTFLADEPKKADVEKVAGTTFANDSFELLGREVYVHCPDGYGNSKLNNTFFENKLKVRATTRNWRTVNELVRMAEGG